ncbi:acetylornithine deacetylase [Roseibium aquae]|uniref:Acetylornithine deacetylase n=1 Tax=Roseibium aquae TaxID=1323746 RepID=A0A916X1U2_9HYPH|nr:ArgE/DapE family deacylase [Roseibium aquae]GGB48931.1 acetylornithine deacetylase [Roseibium aquae]
MSFKLAPARADAICAAVDAAFEDQIAFLQSIVQVPTLRGAEAPAQALVGQALADRGYNVETFGIDMSQIGVHPAYSPATIDYKDTYNLIGRKTPASPSGRSLALNSHMDIVPTAAPDHWTYPPFSAHRDGDWLYGRGAGDMKAGLSANIFALDAIGRAGFTLAGPVQIQSVIDEEVTGNGAAETIRRNGVADAVLIPEPTDERLVSANSGVIKFKIGVRGVPSHPRDPDSGISAIDAALALIGGLRQLEAQWNSEKTNHRGFETLSNPASLNIGTISGGEWPASIPFGCEFEGRIGFYPGDDPWQRAKAFEQHIALLTDADPRLKRAHPNIEWVGVMQSGYRLDGASSAETALARAQEQATGTGLERSVMACYLDAALFVNHAGVPALTYGPVSENIHGIDERVSLSSLKRVTKTIALFAAGWCGLSA